MAEDAAILALRERQAGRAPTGTVGLRSFDEGVVLTMGSELTASGKNYFLDIPGVRGRIGRDGIPGVPIVFAFPKDVFEKYDFPLIVCRRDDITPAMTRWHPGTLQYRAPAPIGNSVIVNSNPGNPDAPDLLGFNQMQAQRQRSIKRMLQD